MTLRILLALICLLLMQTTIAAKENIFSCGEWTLLFNDDSKAVSLSRDGQHVISNSIPSWNMEGIDYSFGGIEHVEVDDEYVTDKNEEFRRITIRGHIGETGISQYYMMPAELDYAIAGLELSSTSKEIVCNGINVIDCNVPYNIFSDDLCSMVSVPYDNDAWVRYKNNQFGVDHPLSYEVAAVINNNSHQGVIIGSLQHKVWKTGIRVTASAPAIINSLKVSSGTSSPLSRDIIPHGAVRGRSIKSPKIFVGYYADWRDGMEGFAEVNAVMSPTLPRTNKRPFGWNSWGKIQDKINVHKAIEVSDYFIDNLQPNSFNNDGTVYIGLDSYWNENFSEEDHREFVANCRSNGQKAGIYYCPFTDWHKNPYAIVCDEMPDYKYADTYLYGNGEICQFDGAYALDPTHPAIKARIKRQLEQFIDWGYEYVKLDFMAHGAFESDRHFDPQVTTGTQAYNKGMQFIDSIVADRMWINLSIAPIFPANYANSRRIGCDAWGSIENTEYTLNALTYGWWLDHLYEYNDADHIVLEGMTDGENRARVTSSAITGVYIIGDDMSRSMLPEVEEKLGKFMTNPLINAMARECKSFRPVDFALGDKSANSFYYNTGDKLYLAVFNFDNQPLDVGIPFVKLSIPSNSKVSAIELWSGETKILSTDRIISEIPPKDVRVYRISY